MYSYDRIKDQLPYTLKKAGFVARRVTMPAAGFVACTGYATGCQFCSLSRLRSLLLVLY